MSIALISVTDPAALKNDGVPVELVQTRNTRQAAWEAHPEGVTSTYHVKYTTTRLMELEGRYGSLAAWERALDEKMLETLVASISVGLGGRTKGWPEPRVAEALAFGQIKDYRLAVSAAYAMALGRDPKDVKESLLQVEGDMPAASQTTMAPQAWTASDSPSSTTTDASSGATSGPAGWETATPATSSGTSPSDNSSPSSNPWQ